MITSSIRIEEYFLHTELNRYESGSREIVSIFAFSLHDFEISMASMAIKCFVLWMLHYHCPLFNHCKYSDTLFIAYLHQSRSIIFLSFFSVCWFVDHYFMFWIWVLFSSLSAKKFHFMTNNLRFISIEPFCLCSFYGSNFFPSKIEVSLRIFRKKKKRTEHLCNEIDWSNFNFCVGKQAIYLNFKLRLQIFHGK